jgi:uncharacterized phage-associated protein
MQVPSNFDPRVVANYIIRNARRPIRQIALQKLLYFSHGLYLVRTKEPLVKGYFEAWRYGPVHPAIYRAFRCFGREPITRLAESSDLRTGEMRSLPELQEVGACDVIDATLRSYEGFTDGQLVDLSHASGGPWDIVKRRSERENLVGLRIPNNIIRQEFGRHKLSSCKLAGSGDVYDDEDAPITYHGFG